MRPRDAGFTLLEVTVALVVFGLLLLGLGRGVTFGLQAWDRQASSLTARSDMDAVDRTLRRLIERLDPSAEFAGRAHAVAFTSRLPETATLDTREADMVLTAEGGRLILRWTPHLHARRLGPAPAPEITELLPGVERLDVAYWPADGGGWRDTWSDRDKPAMVRARLVFPRGDARHWPDIVANVARDPPDQ